MGLFSFGGGSHSYKSKNIPEYENWASSGIAKRAGIRQVENPEYTAWKANEGKPQGAPAQMDARGHYIQSFNPTSGMMQTGFQSPATKAPQQYSYDTSEAGAPISRESAIAPYQNDLNTLAKANAGFENPYQFNYDTLQEEYGNKAFASGSRDIRRQGQGDLQKLQETVGVRRPGLLLKAGQQNQRNVAEQLAKMRTDIDLGVMNKNVDLKSQQQKDQAEEKYRYLQGLQGGAAQKVGLESNITEQERAYKDQALNYLKDLFLGTAETSKSQKSSFGIG